MVRVGVALLGSTGSIGRQTLEVIRGLGSRFRVLALAAGANTALLLQQIKEFHPVVVSVGTEEAAARLHRALLELGVSMGEQPEVLWGEEGLKEIATHPQAEIVVNGLVGAVGLLPTLLALEAGKRVCLANKESLVIGGHLVRRALSSGGGELIPVDSEHSALFQLLLGRRPEEVKRIILTASGGAVRDRPLEELARVTPREVLAHPTWRMGRRITVDSATLANKGFEVIEAHWLFGLEYDRIMAVLHPQSVVHGLVELTDGTVLAGLSPPDMRLPIAYALTYPERLSESAAGLNFCGLRLEFAELDPRRYPAFAAVVEAGRRGGTFPAAINGADEVLVERFLRGEIPFTKIAEGLRLVLEEHHGAEGEAPGLEEVFAADRWGRERAWKL